MANRTKFLHFKTSAGFQAEIEKNSGLTGDSALTATNNGCYYFICFIKETDQIYTHGNMYDCSYYDDSELRELISSLSDELETKATSSDIDNIRDELEENERVIAEALTDFNNKKADISDIPDVSSFITEDEVNVLIINKVDEDDLVTINGSYLVGEGNITTPDTSVIDVDHHYKNPNFSQNINSGFAVNISCDAAGHITSIDSRSITETDIPDLSNSYLSTSGGASTGMLYAPDFVTTSDNRLKDFVCDIPVDFNSLKQIPKKYYYWKDKSMGEDLQIGTSAQELAKVYPECVNYDEDSDRYSVNYQKLSIVALAAIDKLYDRVSELESKLYDKNN